MCVHYVLARRREKRKVIVVESSIVLFLGFHDGHVYRGITVILSRHNIIVYDMTTTRLSARRLLTNKNNINFSTNSYEK